VPFPPLQPDQKAIGVPVASVQETTIRGLTVEIAEENERLHPRLSWKKSPIFSNNSR
jgi:hypothetical protein